MIHSINSTVSGKFHNNSSIILCFKQQNKTTTARKDSQKKFRNNRKTTTKVLRAYFFLQPAILDVSVSPYVLSSLYCKRYGPISDCSQGSSLIRVHIVCLHKKVQTEVHLTIFCRGKKSTFSGQITAE